MYVFGRQLCTETFAQPLVGINLYVCLLTVAQRCFFGNNFDNSGYPIWAPSPKIKVLSYSDASGLGWGGFAVLINGKPALGSWSEDESGRSSTFSELRAIQYVLESYSDNLRGKEECNRTDHRNAEIILSVGSQIPDLHREAVLVYKLCCKLNIRLSVE